MFLFSYDDDGCSVSLSLFRRSASGVALPAYWIACIFFLENPNLSM